jgi:hypothetical protein
MTQRPESIGAPLVVFLFAALATALLLTGSSEPAVHPSPRTAAGPPAVAAPKRPRLASVAALPAPLRPVAKRTATRRRVAPTATPSTATVGSSPAATAQPAPAAPPSSQAPVSSPPQDTAPAPQPTPAPTFDDSGSGPTFDDGGTGP